MAPSRGSMIALLGAVALLGYQNRDKIGQALGGLAQGTGQPGQAGQQGGLGGLLGGLSGALGSGQTGGVGGILNGGLSDLMDRFRQSPQRDVADSWVSTGANRELQPNELEQAIGGDTLDELSRHTGLSRDELVTRLSRDLPKTVDSLTPDGRIPDAHEADSWGQGGMNRNSL